MRLALLVLISVSLVVTPVMASEAAPPPAPEVAPEAAPEYPPPELLKKSRVWTGVGATMTATGGAMLVSGLFLGSAIARGELVLPSSQPTLGSGEFQRPGGGTLISVLFGGGVLLGFVGLPLLSAGVYMNKQLRRTIKGAEKVPRIVAAEERYWNAYLGTMFAQAMMVAGGGQMLLGVLTIVAVAATVGTDVYQPYFWAFTISPFATGAGMIAGGVAINKKSKAKMEAVWDEVDPLRQKPEPVSLGPDVRITRHGAGEVRASFGWAFAF